ncbi:MAG: class I SAM-dependent methyltransferase [Planctomycetes bacterium]|nr:class I SAM-dependent methyltransferase [Planctomycetota bacterium]
MDKLIDILLDEKPAFQIQSGNKDVASSEALLFEASALDTSGLKRTSAALPEKSLRYLDSILSPGQVTIEIGGGQSTVLFASKVKKHYCINPDHTANVLIREYLESKGYNHDNLVFIEESSDLAYLKLSMDENIDVALLDGNHSFPFPMVDWHYVNKYLRSGSYLLVDNVEITAVKILTEYLNMEPAYRLIKRVYDSSRYDCYCYEKILDDVTIGWKDQCINQTTLARLSLRTMATKFTQKLVDLINIFRKR